MLVKKNKKGQGHVEIILSFVIFIGAIILLFIFINPFARTKITSATGEVQEKIIEKISLDVGKLSIITNSTESCYEFNESNYNGNYVEISEIERKYDIYFGKIFENKTTKKGCAPLNYSLGIYSIKKMIVYDEIIKLVTEYNEDYDALKTSLGIKNEFSFLFKNIKDNEISELSVSKNIPAGVNVISNEVPVRVINKNGEILELVLNIREW